MPGQKGCFLGEGSIRYDFFAALMETYHFRPCQIHLEVPLNPQTFILSKEKISFRKKKPLIDLVVLEPDLHLSVEFGLFRQNSNEDGTINQTAHFTSSVGLFVCVADHKMIGHRLENGYFRPFPCDYEISNEFINYQLTTRTNKFDKRFLNVFQPFNKRIISRLFVEEELQASKINNDTWLLV